MTQARPQVSGQMRTSGHGSATMQRVPAGVAQLAERPSCKRQVSGSIPLTGSTLQGGDLGKRWVSGGLDTAPIAVGNTAYVGSSSGKLCGLSVQTGKAVWSTNVGASIPAPDEQNVSQPLTGLAAGQGLLVVPAGDELAAYWC